MAFRASVAATLARSSGSAADVDERRAGVHRQQHAPRAADEPAPSWSARAGDDPVTAVLKHQRPRLAAVIGRPMRSPTMRQQRWIERRISMLFGENPERALLQCWGAVRATTAGGRRCRRRCLALAGGTLSNLCFLFFRAPHRVARSAPPRRVSRASLRSGGGSALVRRGRGRLSRLRLALSGVEGRGGRLIDRKFGLLSRWGDRELRLFGHDHPQRRCGNACCYRRQPPLPQGQGAWGA